MPTEPAKKPPDPDMLLKLTVAMRAQGVANFKYGEAHVAFWQPMPVATADLRNFDPGADTALYSERDLFGDPEDPDAVKR